MIWQTLELLQSKCDIVSRLGYVDLFWHNGSILFWVETQSAAISKTSQMFMKEKPRKRPRARAPPEFCHQGLNSVHQSLQLNQQQVGEGVLQDQLSLVVAQLVFRNLDLRIMSSAFDPILYVRARSLTSGHAWDFQQSEIIKLGVELPDQGKLSSWHLACLPAFEVLLGTWRYYRYFEVQTTDPAHLANCSSFRSLAVPFFSHSIV